jgi:hypothetical protein
MSTEGADLDAFVTRLEYVAMRLQRHAAAPTPSGLTDPDEPSGEQWDWGQVWAHLGEFIPYWISQMRLIIEARGPGPVPFGRTKTDPGRVDAIERDRNRPNAELWSRLQRQLGELRKFLEELPAEAWTKQGEHPTLGTMDLPRIVDAFLVGHLEDHATQLDGLAAHNG